MRCDWSSLSSIMNSTAEAASSNHGCLDISHPLHQADADERLHFRLFCIARIFCIMHLEKIVYNSDV